MLRQCLHDLAPMEVGAQLVRLEELRTEFGHTVLALSTPISNLRFNCVMYALGVEQNAELYRLLVSLTYGPQKDLDISMDTGFIRWLVDAGSIAEVNAENAELAVYAFEDKYTHIGRVLASSRVQSKWGSGHLYEHAPLEVPFSYGDTVQYFSGADVETVLNEFWSYAESKGAIFDGD
jgi:hypothetical protein